MILSLCDEIRRDEARIQIFGAPEEHHETMRMTTTFFKIINIFQIIKTESWKVSVHKQILEMK